MSEVTEVLTPEIRVAVAEARVRQLEHDVARRLEREPVREAILSLVGELLSESDPADWESEAFGQVNEALESLGLEKLSRTFRVRVQGKVSIPFDVEIDVEAESLEEAIDAVNDGQYESEILDEASINDAEEIESYDDVDEA